LDWTRTAVTSSVTALVLRPGDRNSYLVEILDQSN
jgi:hypothetical protein